MSSYSESFMVFRGLLEDGQKIKKTLPGYPEQNIVSWQKSEGLLFHHHPNKNLHVEP